MSYSGKFATNLDILKNGVYGNDVRQAIWEMFSGHKEIIDNIQRKLDNMGSTTPSEPENPDTENPPSGTSNGSDILVATVIYQPTIGVISDQIIVDYA